MSSTAKVIALADAPRRHSPPSSLQHADLLLLLMDDVVVAALCMLPMVLAAERLLSMFQKSEGKGTKSVEHSPLPPFQLEANLFLVIPLAFSGMLILLYFFFTQLEFFLAIYVSVFSIFACSFTLWPISTYICRLLCSGGDMSIVLPVAGSVTISTISATVIASGLVIAWLVTANWILLDILGVGLVVCMLCHIRLPSLRAAAAIFLGLVAYDIFWVFFSERIFRKNVMVEVAMKEAHNPVAVIAQKIGFPTVAKSSPPIALPGKLIFHGMFSRGISVLGLGDVFVPGLVVCYARWFDYLCRYERAPGKSRRCISYYMCSLVGFFFGVLTSSIASLKYRVAQPALMYIVPASLLPLIALSMRNREARALWHGKKPFVPTSSLLTA